MRFKAFLRSKKVKAFILGLIALVASALLELDPETVQSIKELTAVYLGAQGLADFGKGKVDAVVESKEDSIFIPIQAAEAIPDQAAK